MNRAAKREDINIAYGADGHLFHVGNWYRHWILSLVNVGLFFFFLFCSEITMIQTSFSLRFQSKNMGQCLCKKNIIAAGMMSLILAGTQEEL